MAEKHIFIGLGGSGVNTVSLIKYKVYERTKATEMKSRLQVMNDTYRFIFVDTDSRDIENKNKEKYAKNRHTQNTRMDAHAAPTSR